MKLDFYVRTVGDLKVRLAEVPDDALIVVDTGRGPILPSNGLAIADHAIFCVPKDGDSGDSAHLGTALILRVQP